MTVSAWTFVFVGLSFGLYLLIAWLSRVRDTQGFYVAGRGVPAAANGMATAADWMSAASFISMAGLISFMGYAGGMYLMGWTGGYVLLALLLAPYLRKFGHFTVPDFIGDRYASNTARLVAVISALFVSFTYVAGQMRGVGVVFSRFLEVDINVGVAIGMAIVFVYATLGGMKGITWTQVAQYWVLITAFLIPAIAISIRLTGHAFPQIGLGSELIEGGYLLDKLDKIHADLGFSSYTAAFDGALGHGQCLPGDPGLDGRNRRTSPRHRSLLHGEDRPGGPHIGLLGPVLHLPALPDGAGHRSLRPLLHDRLASGKDGRAIAGLVQKLGEDRIDPLAGRRRPAASLLRGRRQRDLQLQGRQGCGRG